MIEAQEIEEKEKKIKAKYCWLWDHFNAVFLVQVWLQNLHYLFYSTLIKSRVIISSPTLSYSHHSISNHILVCLWYSPRQTLTSLWKGWLSDLSKVTQLNIAAQGFEAKLTDYKTHTLKHYAVLFFI